MLLAYCVCFKSRHHGSTTSSILEELPTCLWQSREKMLLGGLGMGFLRSTSISKLFLSQHGKKCSFCCTTVFLILNWPTQYNMILYKCLPKMKHMKNMGFSEFRRESADSLFFHARLPQSDNFDLFAGLCLMICFLVAVGKASGSYLYLCYLQTILVATTWTSLIVIDFVELSGIYSKDSSIPFHSIRISIHSDFLSPAISSLPFPAFFATKKWVSSFQNRHDGSPAKRWSTSALGLDCVCVCLFVCLSICSLV